MSKKTAAIDRKVYILRRMVLALNRAILASSHAERERAAQWLHAWRQLSTLAPGETAQRHKKPSAD